MLAPKVFSLKEERLNPEKAAERITRLARHGNKKLRPENLLQEKVPEYAIKKLVNRTNFLKEDLHNTKHRTRQAFNIANANNQRKLEKSQRYSNIESYIDRTRKELSSTREHIQKEKEEHVDALIKSALDLLQTKKDNVEERKAEKSATMTKICHMADEQYERQNTLINMERNETREQLATISGVLYLENSVNGAARRQDKTRNELNVRTFKQEELDNLQRNRAARQVLMEESTEKKKNYEAMKHEKARTKYDKWYKDVWANVPELQRQTEELMKTTTAAWEEHGKMVDKMIQAQEQHQIAINKLDKSIRN